MNQKRVPYTNLSTYLKDWSLSDTLTRDHLIAYLQQQANSKRDIWGRLPNQMFWPPRVVTGVREDSLTVFFGTGISLAAGFPDWASLLRQVGLDAEVERDPSASGDPLTLAELAAHAVGADPLQTAIRRAFTGSSRPPTTAHLLLAALHLPLYITTNYDCLFENAVEAVHQFKPDVITNDLDVKRLMGDGAAAWKSTLETGKYPCCVVKLHGSVGEKGKGEHLILTRSDYRRHYRSNPLLLEFVRYALETRHTLFLGFSHRDPEVGRIIEDVIFTAENKRPPEVIPGFYSLQFDMLQKTPEVFAARGIVALQPSLVLPSGPNSDVRGCSLAQGLADLMENAESKLDEALSLDQDLRRISDAVTTELRNVLDRLTAFRSDALNVINSKNTQPHDLTDRLVQDFGEFANQGVYLADQYGRIVSISCPSGLNAGERGKVLVNIQERPYFRLAQSNRQPFVSDVFESTFNHNATLAACLPLIDRDKFQGLLFLAFQLRDTGLASRIRAIQIPNGTSLLITDANGILVIPPEREVEEKEPGDLSVTSEDPASNVGFPYSLVLQVSRRDKRIDRLMQNVVPLAQDDDVQILASDIVSYSVVTELAQARWKVALSRYLRV
ncbi:MAG: SIR2 family protein [Chloroflexota bacterium]